MIIKECVSIRPFRQSLWLLIIHRVLIFFHIPMFIGQPISALWCLPSRSFRQSLSRHPARIFLRLFSLHSSFVLRCIRHSLFCRFTAVHYPSAKAFPEAHRSRRSWRRLTVRRLEYCVLLVLHCEFVGLLQTVKCL